MSTERMRALVDSLGASEWSRAFRLAAQLSEECDRAGILAQWLEVRPLLEAVGSLALLVASTARAVHRADVAEAALTQLLDALGGDDEPRRQGIAHARAALALLEAERARVPPARPFGYVCPTCASDRTTVIVGLSGARTIRCAACGLVVPRS